MSRYGEKIPRLGDAELRAMRESLLSEVSRREAYAPEGTLSIVIDGEPFDSLDPNRQRRVRRAVGDETGWIEVHDRNSGGGLLLAAHHYCHAEVPSKGRKKYATTLEGGQKITFVAYKKDGQPYVEISYGETSFSRALALQGRLLKNELNRVVRLFLDRMRLVFTPWGALPARRAAYSLALLGLCGTLALLIPYLRRGIALDAPPPPHIASNSPVLNAGDILVPPTATTDQPLSAAPATDTLTPPATDGRSPLPAEISSPKKRHPKSRHQLTSQSNAPSTRSSSSPHSEVLTEVRVAPVQSYSMRMEDDHVEKDRARWLPPNPPYRKLPTGLQFDQP